MNNLPFEYIVVLSEVENVEQANKALSDGFIFLQAIPVQQPNHETAIRYILGSKHKPSETAPA